MSHCVSVEVQVASSAVSVPGVQAIQGWVQAAVAQSGDDVPCEVSVRIVDEREARALNKRYRGTDKATNVLSFRAHGMDGLQIHPEVPRLLGDIVVCAPVVEREAAEQGKDVAAHWAHMLVHGALHLLGFDHEARDEATEMEALERRILAAGGVDDPYAM